MQLTNKIRQIYLDKDYNLEEIPRFEPINAFSYFYLAQSIVFGMEVYLAKVVQVVIDKPECKGEEKFWIESQVNVFINKYLIWLRTLIEEFSTNISISRIASMKQIMIQIKLNLIFKGDKTEYTHSYFFIRKVNNK